MALSAELRDHLGLIRALERTATDLHSQVGTLIDSGPEGGRRLDNWRKLRDQVAEALQACDRMAVYTNAGAACVNH